MKILQLHNYYASAGGEDTLADTEADILRQAGHDVARVRVRNDVGGARAVQSLALAPYNARHERRMRELVAASRPDVAHVHNTWFSLSPSVIRGLARDRVPIVVELQNYRQFCVKAQLFRNGRICTDCVTTHPWRGVLHRCYRDSAIESAFLATTLTVNRVLRTWDAVDRYLAPSEFVRDMYVTAGTAAERIALKPPVVPDPGSRDAPPSRSRDILFAARLSPEKGAEVLLEAWRRARDKLPGVNLTVVGDGPLRGKLERAAPYVTFVGWVAPEELERRMLQARALVFPSQWVEPYGLSVVTAMAAGMPVLASDIAGPGELARQLGPEWVVARYDDSDSWASALQRLADDTAVDAAGRRGRELFESRYTFAAGLARLASIYGSVTGGHRGSTSVKPGKGAT